MTYLTKKAKRDFIIFMAIILLSISFAFGKPVKPIHNGYYNAKQLNRRGYKCSFKGTVFITYKRYLELVNNKTITK